MTTSAPLAALRASKLLSKFGFVWLSAADSRTWTETLSAGSATVVDPLRTFSREVWSKSTCVAYGPRVVENEIEFTPVWWVKNASPSRVWFALSRDTPPALWIDAGETTESVFVTCASVKCAQDRNDADRTHHFYFFGGLVDAPDGFQDLEEWLATCPYTMGRPQLTSAPPGDDRTVQTTTFLTSFSQSLITLTAHHELAEDSSMIVGRIDYVPATARPDLKRFNDGAKTTWPLDMPADVVAALMHLEVIDQARAEADVSRAKGDQVPMAVLVDTLMREGEARQARFEALRTHANEAVREATVEAAHVLGAKDIVDAMKSDASAAVAGLATRLAAEREAG
jgi:hypothetical protein